ncbi:hypothetical protein AMJ49_00410 [Parcubacteria bacterium DG_74_2]|nr:MAG: hypothetical protein AMJ49_00410 [Parcubacteria bacterium DG_74_2]
MFKIALRKKIAFLFAFFGLLPLIITAFLTITQIQNSLRETASDNLTSLAEEVMSSVEKTTRNIYIDIELLATNPLIKSKEASNEEKLSEMKKIQDFYRIFEDITLIDLEGNVIISTTYKYRGEWITKQWYQEAKEGKTSISPVHIILSPFEVIISSATPVKDKKGEIIAVVAGQLNMEKIWEITDDVKIGEKGFAFIVNREGRFIAHPNKEKILSTVPYPYFVEKISSKDSGTINYTNENREEMVGGFTSLSDPILMEQGWKLIVTQPESEVFALVNLFQKQVIAIFLGGLVLLLIISYLLSLSIVTPVKKLTGATKKVAAGKLETKIEVKTGDEIEELAKSFNRMTEDLRKSREALEEAKTNLEIKVKERTKELEEAKLVLEIKVQARTKALKELAESLERQVKERTKELQERIDELEKFRRLTVGRELKMIELKEEIKKVREELDKKKS